MNVFEALGRLQESNCVAIRGEIFGFKDTSRKEIVKKYGLHIPSAFFADSAEWEAAYVCENCSGSGRVWVFAPRGCSNDPDAIDKECPECEGEKMIWEDE